MKQIMWILNSSLLALLCMSQFFLYMMQRSVPRRTSLALGVVEVVQEKATTSVDIQSIYEQDLFDTYERPVIPFEKIIDEVVAPLPQPPKIIVPEVPLERAPTFFAPLDVVLKGVIFVKDDPVKCIAIIQSKKTKEEQNYLVGDLIEDAQIIKILSNRIIIIRSNGQQETLYLREEDAIADFNIQAKSTPSAIVESIAHDKYKINIDEFVKQVHNLGEFINLFDITTVYKQGKNFGCRIGKIDKDSLATAMGFLTDDIIVKVDDCFVDDLNHRLMLYDRMMHKRVGDTIEVSFYRGQEVMTMLYGLIDNNIKAVEFHPYESRTRLLEELQKHEASIKASTEQSVIVQAMQTYDGVDKVDQSLEPLNLQVHDVVHDASIESNQVIPKTIGSTNFVTNAFSQASNQDDYAKVVMQDRDKLTSTLQNAKRRDQSNMMRQGSKNIILNGMQ